MDLRPWDYWTRDMRPYPQTVEVMRVLDSVLIRNPKHAGAIHLYIHTVELARPDLAEAQAETLPLRFSPGNWRPNGGITTRPSPGFIGGSFSRTTSSTTSRLTDMFPFGSL